MGLFTADRNIIITNLDAQTIELEPFKYTKATITVFRLFDFDSKEKTEEINAINDMLEKKQQQCENAGLACESWKSDGMLIFEMNLNISPG